MVACICDTPHITQDGWQGSLAEMISFRLCENLSQKVRWRERDGESHAHVHAWVRAHTCTHIYTRTHTHATPHGHIMLSKYVFICILVYI